jgi:hypothetical protein
MAGRIVIALAFVLAVATVAFAAGANFRPRVWCNDAPGGIALRAHPHHCLLEPGGNSSAANLRRLHWRGWGHQHAHALGVDRIGGSPIRVHVTAYRLRPPPCASRYTLYRRVRVKSHYGSKVVHPNYFLCE